MCPAACCDSPTCRDFPPSSSCTAGIASRTSPRSSWRVGAWWRSCIGRGDGRGTRVGERSAHGRPAVRRRRPPRRGAVPLDAFIAVARSHRLPVIVDAAAQIPPLSSLWDFTRLGAQFAIFSGGKGLRGPASTGLIVGEAAGVARCAVNAAPLQRLGRPMKVGKEDLIGFLAAVERASRPTRSRRSAATTRSWRAWWHGARGAPTSWSSASSRARPDSRCPARASASPVHWPDSVIRSWPTCATDVPGSGSGRLARTAST